MWGRGAKGTAEGRGRIDEVEQERKNICHKWGGGGGGREVGEGGRENKLFMVMRMDVQASGL